MNKLEEARRKINECDEKMAELFINRMKAVEEVASYKIENNMPIFDPSREEEVIKRGLERIAEDEYRKYYEEFLHSMMDISKEYQKSIIENK